MAMEMVTTHICVVCIRICATKTLLWDQFLTSKIRHQGTEKSMQDFDSIWFISSFPTCYFPTPLLAHRRQSKHSNIIHFPLFPSLILFSHLFLACCAHAFFMRTETLLIPSRCCLIGFKGSYSNCWRCIFILSHFSCLHRLVHSPTPLSPNPD